MDTAPSFLSVCSSTCVSPYVCVTSRPLFFLFCVCWPVWACPALPARLQTSCPGPGPPCRYPPLRHGPAHHLTPAPSTNSYTHTHTHTHRNRGNGLGNRQMILHMYTNSHAITSHPHSRNDLKEEKKNLQLSSCQPHCLLPWQPLMDP